MFPGNYLWLRLLNFTTIWQLRFQTGYWYLFLNPRICLVRLSKHHRYLLWGSNSKDSISYRENRLQQSEHQLALYSLIIILAVLRPAKAACVSAGWAFSALFLLTSSFRKCQVPGQCHHIYPHGYRSHVCIHMVRTPRRRSGTVRGKGLHPRAGPESTWMRSKAKDTVSLCTACRGLLGNQLKPNLPPHSYFLSSRMWTLFESMKDFKMFENHDPRMSNVLDYSSVYIGRDVLFVFS